MSSNIPIRRTTRTMTRMNKDTENANARPSRITTRAKAQASATDGPITRSAATTFASRAKAVEPQPTEKTAGKRKREVLAEVTEVNKGKKAAGSAKGKEKEKTDDSKNSATTSTRVLRTTTTAKAGSRQPLRKVLTRSAKKETTQAQASASTEESARSLLSADLPVFHIVPREGNGKAGTSAPLASITEDDTERPRVFKKRHTEPEPPSEDPSAMPVSEDMPPAHVDSSRLDEEHIATQLAAAEEDDDTGLWDDLDAEDMDDPYMVAEYIHEITAYLKEREQKTLPVADYMRFHAELSWDAREILLDWIVQIHARYNFLPESFFLTVNLFDRFLSLRPTISLQKLQLVGVSCFCVAVKFEEGVSPSVQELVRLTGETYTSEEICKAERYVLKTIGYDLSSPGPMTWLRRGSKADNLEPQARTIAKYLLEVASFLKDLVATPPSLLAAASLWFARLMLGREDWNANLVHYTTYKEREIVPIANAMLNYVLGEGQSETLYRKYASKKYMKCSVFVRKWALSRFAGGAEVDLVEMLPVIKADIVEARIAKLTAEAEEADAD